MGKARLIKSFRVLGNFTGLNFTRRFLGALREIRQFERLINGVVLSERFDESAQELAHSSGVEQECKGVPRPKSVDERNVEVAARHRCCIEESKMT